MGNNHLRVASVLFCNSGNSGNTFTTKGVAVSNPTRKGPRAGFIAEQHRIAPHMCEALLMCGQGVPEEVPDPIEGGFTTEFHPLTLSDDELAELADTHGLTVFGGTIGSERVEVPLDGTMEEWMEQAYEIGQGSYPNIGMMHHNLFLCKGNGGSR